MSDELPTDYDVIVLGTGLQESILAAAFARIGQKVLHMDRRIYYGSDWATFNFDGIQEWMANCSEINGNGDTERDFSEFLLPGEKVVTSQTSVATVSNVKEMWYIPQSLPAEDLAEKSQQVLLEEEMTVNTELQQHGLVHADSKQQENLQSEDEGKKDDEIPKDSAVNVESHESHETEACEIPQKWSINKIKSLSRKFNLDLSPKLLYARGDLVELLISSNVARYAEFKSVTSLLTHIDGRLQQVPCSRSDVFSTKHVSVVEKRMLMKLLTFCLEFEKHPEEYAGYETKSFKEYLKSRKLTENVQHYVMHGIAMIPSSSSTVEGLRAVQVFLRSLGRFGNTPFLWPLYGSGELPQCFCRLCAVYGGIYCLKRGADAVILNSEATCVGIISQGKRLNCKWLVTETVQAPQIFLPTNYGECHVSRCILITDRTMFPAEKEQIIFLRLPIGDGIQSPVSVIELGSGAMACPKNLYVVHLSCKMLCSSPEDDLQFAVNLLFNAGVEQNAADYLNKPNILWATYFRQIDDTSCDLNLNTPSNVLITSGPGNCIDFDASVQHALILFKKVFDDEDFLPRAPDPEEIVIEDSEPNVANGDVDVEVNEEVIT